MPSAKGEGLDLPQVPWGIISVKAQVCACLCCAICCLCCMCV